MRNLRFGEQIWNLSSAPNSSPQELGLSLSHAFKVPVSPRQGFGNTMTRPWILPRYLREITSFRRQRRTQFVVIICVCSVASSIHLFARVFSRHLSSTEARSANHVTQQTRTEAHSNNSDWLWQNLATFTKQQFSVLSLLMGPGRIV